MMNMDRVDISIAHNDGGPPARPPTKGGSAFGGRLECGGRSPDRGDTAIPPMGRADQVDGRSGSGHSDADGSLIDRLQLGEEAGDAIEQWAGARTRDEVFRALQENSAPAGPVLRPSEVMNSEQMQVREFFDRLEHPVADSARYPQFAARWNGVQRAARTAAPLLGSSTAEVTTQYLSPWSPAQARRAGVI